MVAGVYNIVYQKYCFNIAFGRNFCYDVNAWETMREFAITVGGWLHHPKGGEAMPITLTFHILIWTVTIHVKSRNRHSAK